MFPLKLKDDFHSLENVECAVQIHSKQIVRMVQFKLKGESHSSMDVRVQVLLDGSVQVKR